jgi:hypothetical protein
MMPTQRSHCGLYALFISLVFVTSCSRDPFTEHLKDHPRRFEVGGKGYILSEQEPGVIEDDKILYTADAGARTFNFGEKTILTQLFVGNWKNFDALTPDERKETENIARATLAFISRQEIKRRSLSEVDLQHREILKAFLASDQQGTASAEINNCDFSQFHPLRGSFDPKQSDQVAKPLYPKAAEISRIQGAVMVKLLVGPEGNVLKSCAIQGPTPLRIASEEAGLKCKFTPILLNEKPQYVERMITYNFVLAK